MLFDPSKKRQKKYLKNTKNTKNIPNINYNIIYLNEKVHLDKNNLI